MKAEFKDQSMYLIPESNEREQFTKLFPPEYLKTSKVVSIRPFVDRFGNATEDTYVEIKGAPAPVLVETATLPSVE